MSGAQSFYPGKGLMVLRTLLGCSPFIVCGLLSAFTEWRIGTVVALTLSVVLAFAAFREGGGAAGAVLEISGAVFCAGAFVIAFSTPEAAVSDFVGSLANGWLALTAWLSVAISRPFTMLTERRRVPEPVWRDPAFRQAHALVSSLWSVVFTAVAVVLVIVEYRAPHSGLLEILIQVVGNLAAAMAAARLLSQRLSGGAGPQLPPVRPEAAGG